MKKLLLFICLISFSLHFSQSYKPLLVDGNKWHVTFLDGAFPNNCLQLNNYVNYKYEIIGDSLVNGNTYKKIYYSFPAAIPQRARDCDHFEPVNKNFYLGALLREDIANRKIYKNILGTTNEVVLYDFSLTQNSTFDGSNFDIGIAYIINPNSLSVMSITNGSVFGQNIKAFKFQNPNVINYYYDYYIYEGIGSQNGLLEFIGPKPLETGHWLDCFENTNGISCNSNLILETGENKPIKNLTLYYSKATQDLKILGNKSQDYTVKFFDASGKFLEEVKAKPNESFKLSKPYSNSVLFYIISSKTETWKGKIIL